MENYYQQMQDQQFHKNGYASVPLHQGDWSLMFAEGAGKFEEAGWKFHLSVHPDDVARAWNIAVEEMVKDNTVPQHHAKVARPRLVDAFSKPEDSQAGKMIVIYAGENVPPRKLPAPAGAYRAQKLKTARVRPGLDVKGDNKVPGSSFIFYRNDKDLAGEYNLAAQNANITMARRYNPDRKKDPYKGFSISEAAPGVSLQQAAFWWWKSGTVDGGKPIMRVQVSDETNAQGVIKTLQDLGIKGAMVKSESLGLTVRIYGDDVERIQKTCEAANLQWQEATAVDGSSIMRTPVANKDQALKVIETLQYLGIKGEEVTSKQFGQLTVRIVGDDAKRVQDDMKWVREAQAELRKTRLFPTPPVPPASPTPSAPRKVLRRHLHKGPG